MKWHNSLCTCINIRWRENAEHVGIGSQIAALQKKGLITIERNSHFYYATHAIKSIASVGNTEKNRFINGRSESEFAGGLRST